jgi:hypothetical protein
MKKFRIYLPMLLITLVVLGMSCEDDPFIPDPIDPPVRHTVVIVNDSLSGVTAPGGVVKVKDGEDLTISLTPKTGYIADSAVVNGDTIEIEDNEVYLSDITDDYTIKPLWKKDPSYNWLIAEKPWVEEERWVQQDNGDWLSYTLNPRVTYYSLSGKNNGMLKTIYPTGEVYLDNWKIDQSVAPMTIHTAMNQAFPEGTVEIIEKLDKDQMIVTNLDGRIRVILRHPTAEELKNIVLED